MSIMVKENFAAGDGLDLAEIIIDYDARKVDILNPESRSKIKDSDLNFQPTTLFIILFVYIITIWLATSEVWYDLKTLIILFNLLIFIYLFTVLSTGLMKKLHAFFQWFNNDFLNVKKFIAVKDINDKIYQLPDYLEFKNIKLDYILYGDYAEYIQKIHIKPKDFYEIGISKVKTKQTQKWDCFFYFKEIPIKGKMEIIFI